MTAKYDYVIVGAGSAGCTLANRLSEDGRTRVLLIEAGGWDSHPLLKIPLAWGEVLLNRMCDWGYDSEPEAGMNGRAIEVARGKVIGGSSSINAMAYVRGNRADYDRWASRGLPDWSYEKVLPYFRKQESWEGGASRYRGGYGPVATRKARYQDPLGRCLPRGAQEMGYALNDDYNGARAGRLRPHADDDPGRAARERRHRVSASRAVARTNLTVVTDSLVTRIVIEGIARGRR